jgi:flagellar hook protein FlgE
VAGDSAIRVTIGTTVLGIASEEIKIEGNLSSLSLSPAPKSLMTAAPFTDGGAAATSATLLNDLDSNQALYNIGDSLEITGIDSDGNAVNAILNVDPTTTLGDVVTAINAAYPNATATLDATGAVAFSGNDNGTSDLELRIIDAVGNVGNGGFDDHLMIVTNAGSSGELVTAPLEFFDASGATRVLDVTFRKTETNSAWLIEASMDPTQGTVDTPVLGEIRFNPDGSFKEIFGSAGTSVPISISYAGQAEPQIMQLQLGRSEGFVGLTQTADGSTTLVSSDGYQSGTLLSASVQQDGTLMGIGSNGRQIPIAQLAVGSVVNRGGLTAVGQNMYKPTANSGQVNYGAAASGGKGNVLSGQLESSNVDLAYEFTRLIVAQRGFSANARSITVTDEILDEVSNIIR